MEVSTVGFPLEVIDCISPSGRPFQIVAFGPYVSKPSTFPKEVENWVKITRDTGWCMSAGYLRGAAS